jgi:hypothetical protein
MPVKDRADDDGDDEETDSEDDEEEKEEGVAIVEYLWKQRPVAPMLIPVSTVISKRRSPKTSPRLTFTNRRAMSWG